MLFELFRLRKWQRPQHNGVDDTEDGDVGANAEGESQYRNNRERRAFA
jgi:hypothetical protein